MFAYTALIGEHNVRLTTKSAAIAEFIETMFGGFQSSLPIEVEPDLSVEIFGEYGAAFTNYDVTVSSDGKTVVYERTDYKIAVLPDYRFAEVFVFNDFALKHALINLYSSFIVHRQWGLLVHSSCLLDRNRAILFAGQSGAGKSTVAQLSYPRPILSDEAAIVKVDEHRAMVFNSPFRSDSIPPDIYKGIPLQSIHLLRQAPRNHRSRAGKLNGMMELLSRVFLWPHHAEDAKKTLRMCSKLITLVPVYELHFQKNHTFWEEIVDDDAI